MLVHPQFDPVAIHLGPFGIHWYGLMYLLGFVTFIWLGRKRLRTLNRPGWDEKFLDDLLFYGVLGVVLGGRLGEVLFYNPGYYFSHPLKIFAVWEGGMSFHGGFLGVLTAMVLFARKPQHPVAGTDGFHRAAGAAGPGLRAARQFHQRRIVGTSDRCALGHDIPASGQCLPRHPRNCTNDSSTSTQRSIR